MNIESVDSIDPNDAIVKMQPFANGVTVICIKESPQVWLDGSEIDLCRCRIGNQYTVEFVVWSSVYGWLIATPKPHNSIQQEFHRAADFVLFEDESEGKYEPEECPDCINGECPECNGDGFNFLLGRLCDDCNGTGDCRTCHGNGSI